VSSTICFCTAARDVPPSVCRKRGAYVIDNLLVRIHFIIVLIRWTGLAPWELRSVSARPPVTSRRPSAKARHVSSSEAGSYLRLIDFCITVIKKKKDGMSNVTVSLSLYG